MRISIETNAPMVERQLEGLARDQLPFATALALTKTAEQVVERQRAWMQTTFDIRATRVLKGIRHTKARKRDWPNPTAQAGTLDQFIAAHEKGGTKKPTRGARRIAVPLRKVIPKGSGGKISPTRKPKALVRSGKGVEVKEAIRLARGRGKRSKLKIAYWLRASVVLKPRLRFRHNAQEVLEANYAQNFTRALDVAIRSARVRPGSFTSEQGRFFYLKAAGMLRR